MTTTCDNSIIKSGAQRRSINEDHHQCKSEKEREYSRPGSMLYARREAGKLKRIYP